MAREVEVKREPNKTFDIDKNVAEKIKNDNIKAVIQACYHILHTERYSNPIYDENYGVELEQYIGADYETIRAGIEETVSSALLQDDRITRVTLDSCVNNGDFCTCVFYIDTIYGIITEELNVQR